MLGQLLRSALQRLTAVVRGAPPAGPAVRGDPRAVESNERGDGTIARSRREGIVAVDRVDAAALHELGRVALAQGGTAEAVDLLERALAAAPESSAICVTLGNARRAEGEPGRAAELYARAIELEQDCVEARINLGMLLCERGDFEAGIETLQQAALLRPEMFEAHHNLGSALGVRGRHSEAVESLERAARIEPAAGAPRLALGAALHALGRNEAAVDAYAGALARGADPAEVRYRMGNVYYEMRRLHEARSSLERAMALRPDWAAARNGLGIVLLELRDMAGAIREFERAIELAPDLADAHNNLGMALHRSGSSREAQAAFRRALDLRPDFAEAHSNLILALGFDAEVPPSEQLAERRRWQERHAGDLRSGWRAHGNVRDPDRKLRIGYVSADFRRHSAICGFGPMLLDYDRNAYEVVCYSNSAYEDEFTHRFRRSADRWTSIVGLSDAQAAAAVRADGVDLLVDLSAHSAGNRLLLFARKPAPIQITAWGYANGTGLDAMDYLFSDETTIPPKAARDYSEEVVYLPSILTYLPQGEPPPVGPPPAAANGHVTYGCLNSYAKLTPQSLETWAILLARVPGSRMLFKSGEFDYREPRERVLQVFDRHGVCAERLEFAGATPWREHLAAYGAIDVALDPFPHGGGISTLDALWMGVPVVALRGAVVGGRMAAALLAVVGLEEWVADDREGYLAIAAAAAQAAQPLAALRAALRERIVATPVGDTREYVRSVESVYRVLWRRWCEDGAGKATTT
jgi:predicted O-linked N-acetylglucosamine transferase (SPINDLY family)